MSKQRDDLLAKEQELLAHYENVCWACGHELYTGDPPIQAICTNPQCSQWEFDDSEDYEEEEG